MISQEITLNAWRQNQVSLVAVQGESNSRTIAATLLDNGSPIDLTGCTARLYIEKPDKSAVFCDGTVIDSINGVASFVLPYQATAQYGDSECAIIITGPAKDLRVVGLTLQVSACNLEGAAESTDEFSSLTNALKEVDSLAENLEGLSADAAAQAGYARTQGDYAKNQGDSAKTQAVAAQTAASSASSAANSARTAASSANTSATSANSAAERANAEADRCEALDISALDNKINLHAANKSNPHAVTAAQVGARPSSWTPTYSQIGAAPTIHTSTSTTYGAGTYSSYGHMRFAGNGGSSHYAIPINTTTTTLSTLDTTTYLYTGVYDIAISSSTSGAAGIEGLSSTAVRATLTALPPNNITGLAASATGVEQILSIPKLQKTYPRYCRVTGTEYGTWTSLIDSNDAKSYLYLHIAEEIPENSNLNDYTIPGTYRSTSAGRSQTLVNPPITNGGFKLVVTKNQNDNYLSQFVLRGIDFFIRSYNVDTWSDWKKIPAAADSAELRKQLDTGKTLWSGNWSSGSITVPDLNKYNLFKINMNGIASSIWAYRTAAYFRGLSGMGGQGVAYTYQLGASVSGNTLALEACHGFKHNPSSNHGAATSYSISEIIGII